MKKYILMALMATLCLPAAMAQTKEGLCGDGLKWMYDGYTLTLKNVSKEGGQVAMDDYNLEKLTAPWIKKKFDIRKVQVEEGITRIGSCAFANCHNLQEVIFMGTDVAEIGWGAFLNCSRLRNISLPRQLRSIGTIAFANCSSLISLKFPNQCRVGDQAFVSCNNLKSIELSPTTILGHYVFASEVTVDNRIRHSLYDGELIRVPSYININNCNEYGLAKSTVEKVTKGQITTIDYDYMTSDVDSMIPSSSSARNNTYALIIGNQNYRFASDVPYAIHDARVFAEYCKETLGIPSNNIHMAEDATKQMIMEEELEDWLQTIGNREDKNLIVYYAGHGVPDIKNKNKAYLLPVDVRGTNARRGIALDDFYAKLGDLDFQQTSVFLDACFSGVNRENEGVSEGLRAVEIDAEDATLGNGAVVVFSAAQGNETAQGYPEQGHGLFTYYLLKSIQNSYGNISYGDLADQIKNNVSTKARGMKMHKAQTPSAKGAGRLTDDWRDLRF